MRCRTRPGSQSARLPALAAAALLTLGVAACDSSPDDPASSTPAGPDTGVAGAGPFFDRCGGVTEQEVVAAIGAADLKLVSANMFGCIFETPGGALRTKATFAWYRGSPIARERKAEELSRERVDDITIRGNHGFKGYSTADGLCEIAIAYDADFFEWSVYSPGGQGGDPCAGALSLSEKTAERAKS